MTAAINQARDEGNIELLREIADDPEGFTLRQGWGALDLTEEVEIKALHKLYASLQLEIVNLLEMLNRLHESLSLLTAAYREPLAGGVIEKIRRAGEYWRTGEKALAQIRLAFMGLPEVDETNAYRLSLAEIALEKGVSPSDLMKALGFSRAARDIEKYSPDQPRVPAGSGRESGQWTAGDGARQQYAQASGPPPPIRRLHPDETYETDQKAKHSLEYWRQQSTEEIIQSFSRVAGRLSQLSRMGLSGKAIHESKYYKNAVWM